MITFISGVMNSGKSARLIEEIDKAQKSNQPYLILKPAQDTRDGEFVRTRKHIRKHQGVLVSNSNYMLHNVLFQSLRFYDIVFLDEVQFFSAGFIESLMWHCKQWNVKIVASGLRKNFKGEFFPASKVLLAASHAREYHEGECFNCGSKEGRVVVMMNADNNKLILKGESVQCDTGNNHYETLCQSCYNTFLKESDDEKITDDEFIKWITSLT